MTIPLDFALKYVIFNIKIIPERVQGNLVSCIILTI